ncbi:MAG: hypothetical protein M3252_09135 [Actinomycetota bacterium]|nr:hypothetical protein [Actinomycetota bacterium]
MQRAVTLPEGTGLNRTLLLTLLLLAFLNLLMPMRLAADETLNGLAVGAVLIAVTLPALSRQAAREGDKRLYWLLVAALVLKLIGALVRLYVIDDVYGGIADANGYYRRASEVANRLAAGNYDTGLEFRLGGDWVVLVASVLFTVIGPSKLAGFLFFSWLGFWGIFLMYRAFTIAVPEGTSRAYAYLLFFMPSILFWPSSIGKEAVMTFTLGIAALGAAWILAGSIARGLVTASIGLWLAALVRPHVSGMMVVALAAALLLRPARNKHGRFAPVAKVVGLIGVGVVTILLLQRADAFLSRQGIDTSEGVSGALEATIDRTDKGGSEYAASPLESPSQAPLAIATVLFRPLITEAHNTQARVAAVEGTLLLFLTIVRFPRILRGIRNLRRHSYLAFALIYALLFALAFSSFSNFGILTRERVQMFPFYFVLLAVPSVVKATKQRREFPPMVPSAVPARSGR